MANFLKRTVYKLRQPIACFSAMAAGCLMTSQISAQDAEIPQSGKSQLENLFQQQRIEFSAVPPMLNGASSSTHPLRSSLHSKPTNDAMHQVAGGPSASQLVGSIKQSAEHQSSTTQARMILRGNVLESSVDGQLSGRSEGPAAFANAQVSWQEPNGNDAGNYHLMPLSQRPAANVARANPASVSPKSRTGVHQLSKVTIGQFEAAIIETWGNRLRTATSPDGRYVRVEMPTRVDKRMMMLIDRQAQSLSFEGDESLKESWHQIVETMDLAPHRGADGHFREVALVDPNRAQLQTIQQAAFLMGLSQDITQPAGGNQDGAGQDQEQSITLPPGTVLPQGIQEGALTDTVKILQDPTTGVITLVGSKEDIAVVKKIIEKISAESKEKQAQVKRIPLKNLQSEAVVEQLQEIYDSSYADNAGSAKIQALSTPNALVVVGQPNGIKAVEDMVAAMDVEGDDSEIGGFKTFVLRHISARDAKSRLDSYFNQANLGQGIQLPSPPVTIIADFRSNSVTVKGAKQFIEQAEAYLMTIDVAETDGKTNAVRVFPLRNTLAEDMALVLQDAISGQQANAGQGFNPNQQAAQQGFQNANTQVDPNQSSLGAAQLSLTAIDKNGQKVKSGIMFDVRVTADRNSNSLLVTGPEESMELIATLIEKLDRIPDAETQIKVFEIVNGDAETLLTMLESLFGADANQQQGGQGNQTNLTQLPLQGLSATDGSTLINLRFSFEPRTNTIIASGPAGDLQVVEDLLNRLDAQDLTDRSPRVYRLSNAPALDVVDAINQYLEPRNTIVENDPRTVGTFLQADRAVIVVAEQVSNSVIVSATPSQRVEIEDLIRGLDRRPPMVKVKVLIAQVDLRSAEEFGVDIGIQDSLLFDRGTSVAADGTISGIGFPFNGVPAPIPNMNAVFPSTFAGQALSNLGTGRVNNTLGYGGLVLSAGSDSANILIRALKDKGGVRILSRPTITTVENLQGRVQIGASVPRIAGTSTNGLNVQQDIVFEDVGVILEVTPRVSPDGMIVMAINASKSSVGDESDGITIGFSTTGEPIIAPQINETTASTTLMARSGQTVVFSGLIEEIKAHRKRGAPIISDLPWIGPLFSYETDAADRTELLIIMTPYLLNDERAVTAQNNDDMDRMHWCLSDVAEVYGDTDYYGFQGNEAGIETIYPDVDPSGLRGDPLYRVVDEAAPMVPQPSYETVPPQAQLQPMTREANRGRQPVAEQQPASSNR